MSWQGYALILIGALVAASHQVILRKLLRGAALDATVVTAVRAAGASVSSLVIGLAWAGSLDIKAAFWMPFAATALLNIGIMYGQVRSLQLADASLVGPISSTMPLFVIFVSFFLLGEWPTFWGRVGIILIALGSYVLNLQAPKAELPERIARLVHGHWRAQVQYYLNPWLNLFSNRGVQIALGTAYLGAFAVNFDKLATIATNPFLFTGLVFAVVSVATALPKQSRSAWAIGLPAMRTILIVGILQGFAASLMNAGFYYGIVPYVGSLKRTSIFWTVIFAGAFLGESHMWGRLAGALILYIGVALLAF